MSHILRVPFRLAPGQELNPGSVTVRLGGRSLTLEQLDHRPPTLVVEAFDSAAEAERFINPLWSGVMWAMIKSGISPDADLTPQRMFYSDNPAKSGEALGFAGELVDTIIDTSRPSVHLASKKARFVTAGSLSVSQQYQAIQILEHVAHALRWPNAERVVVDQKFKVALELFSAYHREASPNSRFITLNMVLEALAPVEFRHPSVIGLIEGWRRETEQRISQLDANSNECLALDALLRELEFRKEVSIRKKIRSLVFNELSSEADADEAAATAVRCYDRRSALVHTGYLKASELSKRTEELRKIVLRVLSRRYQRVAQA